MNGQLTPKEREFLHQSVLEAKPKIVLEVGTWKGGGSTWQIVKALEEIGCGILYTCETEWEFFDEAAALYVNNPNIMMHLLSSGDLIRFMVDAGRIPDFIFFDGPEDELTAVADFIRLSPHLKTGAIFTMHDWDAPSIKAKKMRPFLESLQDWKILETLTTLDSVGFVKAVKL